MELITRMLFISRTIISVFFAPNANALITSSTLREGHGLRDLHYYGVHISQIRHGRLGRSCTYCSEKASNNLDTIVASKPFHKNSKQQVERNLSSNPMVKYGLFLSRFSEGVLENQESNNDNKPTSKLFLQYSLAATLMTEYINFLQREIESSAKYSPCAGPNIDYLNLLNEGDTILKQLHDMIAHSFSPSNIADNYKVISSKIFYDTTSRDKGDSKGGIKSTNNTGSDFNQVIQFINQLQNTITTSSVHQPTIKVLYIPTAMYALRKNSENTPGKQRQRARADGKKRRDKIVQCLNTMFQDDNDNSLLNTLTVTLDLDDGSIKQPNAQGSRFDDYNENELKGLFPRDGKESLTTWSPHLIYIDGGNTFWLQHCIEKGNWSDLIIEACSSANANPAMYVGSSAGAIVAGKYVETATWKVRQFCKQ